MFGLFRKNEDVIRIKKIKSIYGALPERHKRDVFHNSCENAQNILAETSKRLEKTKAVSMETSLKLCAELCAQVWIRKSGILSLELSETENIKKTLCIKYSYIPVDALNDVIDLYIQYLYLKEPKIKARDEIHAHMQIEQKRNAEKNTDVEKMYTGDEEYGLVVDKPVFVNGFGNDHVFLGSLQTSTGGKLTYKRICSCDSDNVVGLVDLYEMYTEDGTVYGCLYVCNYGKSMPTVAPRGYAFKKRQ